jgi:hypothetical protein
MIKNPLKNSASARIVMFLAIIVAGTLTFEACKKKEDPAPTTNTNTTLTCPTFNTLEVTWGGNSYSVTNSLISCNNSGRYIINHGGISGRRVRVIFAAKPTAAKNYTIIEASSATPGANECMIEIQQNSVTEWKSKGGGTVLACTVTEDSQEITRAQWELIPVVNVDNGNELNSNGQTGCIN